MFRPSEDIHELTLVRLQMSGAKPKGIHCRLFLSALFSICLTLIAAVPSFGTQKEPIGECLAREGGKSIIDKERRSVHERKLFVTPDEVARYVFLTNRGGDGDRSAAVYQASRKTGSLPGAYWVTVTEAPDSLIPATRNIRISRHDSPLPASAALVLHELWRVVLEQSPLNEHAIPCAPTAVFSIRTPSGARISAVTVYLDQDSICVALINLGELLIDYGRLPVFRRLKAADKIEKESRRLLGRLTGSKRR
jgi:hypothetical protein